MRAVHPGSQVPILAATLFPGTTDMTCTTRRIRRSRRKLATLPPGAIYVGRPTVWGNPFQDRVGGHARSVIYYENWLAGRVGALLLESRGFSPSEIDALARKRSAILTGLPRLAGRDLACWCPLTSDWCHANTLIRLAA